MPATVENNFFISVKINTANSIIEVVDETDFFVNTDLFDDIGLRFNVCSAQTLRPLFAAADAGDLMMTGFEMDMRGFVPAKATPRELFSVCLLQHDDDILQIFVA